MRRMYSMLVALVIVCTAIGLSAQTSAATPQNSATSSPQAPRLQFSPGALLRAELDKTVDAKKVKVGDVVVVKLTDDLKSNGEVLAPKGSEILAHVTQVAQHQGNSPSVLGIAFDKLKLKDGSDIPFQATIQAVGFPDEATGSEDVAGGSADSRRTGPGSLSGTGGTMGQPSGYPGQRMPTAGSGTGNLGPSGTKLSPNAKGVVGIPGASLSVGPAQDSVISSQKHNVKLESGAQMILRVE